MKPHRVKGYVSTTYNLNTGASTVRELEFTQSHAWEANAALHEDGLLFDAANRLVLKWSAMGRRYEPVRHSYQLNLE